MENIEIGEEVHMYPNYLEHRLLVTVPLPVFELLEKYFDELVHINEISSYDDTERKVLRITELNTHQELVKQQW